MGSTSKGPWLIVIGKVELFQSSTVILLIIVVRTGS